MTIGPARPSISVKFSAVGRVHPFHCPDPAEPPTAGTEPGSSAARPAAGDMVVVQTPDGPSMGVVVPNVPAQNGRRPAPADAVVLRIASHEDAEARFRQVQRELEAHRVCLMKIRERGLPMKLTRVEQLFDGSRLVFYYTAEGRVDFRELVRDLAAHFRTRIEMRQIGVRDEARMLGGYGACGRPLCCTTFLQGFEPVSIRMAKQQNLSLNPAKLSGICGRLKCCLRYELPAGAAAVTHGGSADETAPVCPLPCGGACPGPCGPDRSGSCP